MTKDLRHESEDLNDYFLRRAVFFFAAAFFLFLAMLPS
jgi:hypothetical protein